MSTDWGRLLVQHHGSEAILKLEEAIQELLKTQDCAFRSQIVEVEELREYLWRLVEESRS